MREKTVTPSGDDTVLAQQWVWESPLSPRARTHARCRSRTVARGRVAPGKAAMRRCSSLMYVEYTSLLAPCLAAFRGNAAIRQALDNPS